jgi:hypothetical protein
MISEYNVFRDELVVKLLLRCPKKSTEIIIKGYLNNSFTGKCGGSECGWLLAVVVSVEFGSSVV